MLVLKLMNENENWRDILSADPYNIIIKEDREYVLLKYSQLNSDFANPIVRECRGSIFRQENGKWICVCRAFDKFGNYGESYVPEIDWGNAVVTEKIDGSLMKLWYDKGAWRLSTNGTIDAFEAELNDWDMTFGDYFVEALNCSFNELTMMLSEDYCYMFELVGPKNRVVIDYDKVKLYALGQRNMTTMEETIYSGPADEWINIYLPTCYDLKNLDEVIKVANMLSKDEEGFVVRDGQFNRMKIKSPEYLMAARLRNNGVITKKRIVEMFLNETTDDFLAYCPQYREMVNEVKTEILLMTFEIIDEERGLLFDADKKSFAEFVKDKKYKHFFFAKYKNPELAPIDWMKTLWMDNLMKKLEEVEKEN